MSKSNLLLLATLVAILPALGCAHKVEVPREVRVPVPVPCVAERPLRPALATRDGLLAMPGYARTLAAWRDLKTYERYAAELEALVEGCSRISAP